MWRELRETWPEIEWTARWPIGHVDNIPDTAYFAKLFWGQDLEDVLRADFVLVYTEDDDKLRGALVEAGMAIASGKSVIVVGDSPEYGTWQYHKAVYRVPTLNDARKLLECFAL
jgi:nucleoside 2-deoxyribosyltransferase